MNKLITNNQTTNFYNHITKLLLESKSFIFNVAFINFSGVQLLLDYMAIYKIFEKVRQVIVDNIDSYYSVK